MIHGVARDAFGWALKAGDQGTVLIKRNGAIVAQAPIDEGLREAENFRVLVPMDSNPADPYRAGAQVPGVSFTVEVKFPSVTMLVTSLKASQQNIGQPGASVFLDFTVGEDTDQDGIPDDWERWQLSAAGIAPGDPSYSLATLGLGDFDHDGTSDFVEYLAGTFAFLTEESLSLKIDGFHTDGSAILQGLIVFDKAYRIESSADLKTWSPATVRMDDPMAATQTSFTATNTYSATFYAAITAQQTKLFYRLILLR